MENQINKYKGKKETFFERKEKMCFMSAQDTMSWKCSILEYYTPKLFMSERGQEEGNGTGREREMEEGSKNEKCAYLHTVF